jgi:hypothetical protein
MLVRLPARLTPKRGQLQQVMGSLCLALKKRRKSPSWGVLCNLVEEKASNRVVETVSEKVNNCLKPFAICEMFSILDFVARLAQICTLTEA